MLLAGRINAALDVRISMADLFKRRQRPVWTAGSIRWLTRASSQATELGQ
jgi:hypothetical protein